MIGGNDTPTGDLARTHPELTDAQTGLANQLHFDLIYNYIFDAGDRGIPFVILLLSVGADAHTPGEQVRTIGQCVLGVTRSTDLVSHMGSGKYVLLLLGTNAQGARIAADRIEAALADMAPGDVSFGLAAYAEGVTDAQTLLRSADTALLAAEAMGGGIEFA